MYIYLQRNVLCYYFLSYNINSQPKILKKKFLIVQKRFNCRLTNQSLGLKIIPYFCQFHLRMMAHMDKLQSVKLRPHALYAHTLYLV